MLLSIKRSNKKGTFINAKPILLISFFELIAKGVVNDNKFLFDEKLIHVYNEFSVQFEKEKNITSCVYPFYHIRNDGFINITFKDFLKSLPHTPSARFLRENIKYASLDNALWDLLQNEDARIFLREVVIKNFLTYKTNKI